MRFFLAGLVCIGTFFSLSGVTKEGRVEERVRDLEIVRSLYETVYAPMEWKEAHYNYRFEDAFKLAKEQIIADPNLSIRGFHQVIQKFLGSLNDYHVDVTFDSEEVSILPFDVLPSKNQFFLSWIESSRTFRGGSFRPEVGDELIEFNGQPAALAIRDLQQKAGRSANEETDRALAAISLTLRFGGEADITPEGEALVKIRSAKKGVVSTFKVDWYHAAESFKHPHDFLESWLPFWSQSEAEEEVEVPSFNMIYPPLANKRRLLFERASRGRFGSPKGPLPALGSIVWEYKRNLKNFKEEPKDPPLRAYMYKNEQNNAIGYVRIPSFSREDINEFGTIINTIEKHAELLVIDILDNPGGDVNYMFDTLSVLADRPMKVLTDVFKLNYGMIRKYIALKQNMEAYLDLIAQAESALKVTSPAKQQEIANLKRMIAKKPALLRQIGFLNQIVEEWNAGHLITKPLYFAGVSKINPNPAVHFSKPVVLLINELDMSCGDYFAAVLKDNGRALLFGKRTAGAGGAVETMNFDYTNTGIKDLSYTTSIGNRLDFSVLEDFGVEPHVVYDLAPEDIQNNYSGYLKSLNETIAAILRSRK